MKEKRIKYGMSSDMLKLVAMAFMLVDHLWATVVPGSMWMTCIGRMAFPIFAFGIAEGYAHTSDRKAYMKRLFKWALISEVPFNIMTTGSPVFPFHQNVMFTFLLALMAMSVFDRLVAAQDRGTRVKCGLRLAAIACVSVIGFPDYGFFGVLTAFMFHVLRGKRLEKPLQLVMMVLINMVWMKGFGFVLELPWGEVFIPQQSFAVLSLVFIWLYNGEKGSFGSAFRRFGYAFYPLHMFLLWLYAFVA